MCPLLLPPEHWCEPTTCYILTDSIFQCKCGLEKSSEPSLGKMAPKALCWGTQTHRLSWVLSCQKTGTNSAQGGTKDILPGVQRPLPSFSYPCVMISYSDCKCFFSSLLCALGHADSTATLNSRWQYSIITQECNGCHMGLCSIQLFTGPAEQ